jgi:hypothetical protein
MARLSNAAGLQGRKALDWFIATSTGSDTSIAQGRSLTCEDVILAYRRPTNPPQWYRHALERQHGAPDLPYRLEVSHDGVRVLSVVRTDDGASAVSYFIRSVREDDALAL